jgi:CRP/FNR family transcriptional regulator, cyclic AMP receptor protein
MNYDSRTLEVLKKVPFFEGLSPSQVKNVLEICHAKALPQGEALCTVGEASNRMFVVLKGTVSIGTANGSTLMTEEAITTIGETGALTGEPRSVTVKAMTDCNVLELNRVSLTDLLRDDASLASRVYRNVMMSLRRKLVTANEKIDELKGDSD